MRVPVFHVNAFAPQPFAGNPAAVCPLNGWLDDQMLRKVAAENNLSATAFFVPQENHYQLRWFTPRCEIRLCGHATLASAYVLLNLLQPGLKAVRFETRSSAILTVHKDDALFSMNFPAMFPKPCTNVPDDFFQALGHGPLPAEVLEANDTYIAVYEAESAIRSLRPNFARLERLHPYAVAVTAPGEQIDFVSRYFAPSYGVPEDPVTGSVHCALAPYWADRLGKERLRALQVSDRGGELWCDVAGNRIVLKGVAVLTLQGSLQL